MVGHDAIRDVLHRHCGEPHGFSGFQMTGSPQTAAMAAFHDHREIERRDDADRAEAVAAAPSSDGRHWDAIVRP